MGSAMDETFSLQLDDNRTLWLTEISRQTFDEQALSDLGGDGGLFVVLEDLMAGTFDVLAKVASQGAGRNLMALLVRAGNGTIALA